MKILIYIYILHKPAEVTLISMPGETLKGPRVAQQRKLGVETLVSMPTCTGDIYQE